MKKKTKLRSKKSDKTEIKYIRDQSAKMKVFRSYDQKYLKPTLFHKPVFEIIEKREQIVDKTV